MTRAVTWITFCLLPAAATRAQAPVPDQDLRAYEVPSLTAEGENDATKIFGDERHNGRRRMRKLADMVAVLVALGVKDRVIPVGLDHVVVLAPKPVHEQVRSLVNRNRKARKNGELIALSVRWLAMPEAAYTQHVVPALSGSKDDARSTQLDKQRLEALLANVRPQTLRSTSIRLNPLRIVESRAITQSAYVKEYKLEATKNAAIADPVIDVIQDGMILEACAALRANDRIAVSLDATFATLERPIKTVKQKLLGSPVTIQKPNVDVKKLDTTVVIADDHSVLFDLGKVHDKFQVVVFEVRRVSE